MKLVFILELLILLSHVAMSQDTPVYRDNEIVGYLYAEIPTVNLEGYYVLDTLNILGEKVIVQTGVSYFSTDIGIELFCPATNIEVEEMNSDTAVIRFLEKSSEIFGVSVKKDKSGKISIYNIFTFDINNRDEICIEEIDRLIDEKIIFTHTGHDTLNKPVCNHSIK
ncbi:MAG: hypothetical protein LBU83_07935 [Bacteroidales bacterium]|jgi:hypothetical protein|nr:hypothetical protein [Bacteroidales bacterium]